MLSPYQQITIKYKAINDINFRCSANYSGFSLIEVMIAVVVISIGLLGLANLQGTSIRNNHDSYLRSQATLLGHEILDRMRANRSQAITGQYDLLLADTPASSAKQCEDTGSAADDCSAAEMVIFDRAAWVQRVATSLPGGDAAISSQVLASSNRALITIAVQWGDQSTSQFVLSSEI